MLTKEQAFDKLPDWAKRDLSFQESRRNARNNAWVFSDAWVMVVVSDTGEVNKYGRLQKLITPNAYPSQKRND
jgi:hypothetical protein